MKNIFKLKYYLDTIPPDKNSIPPNVEVDYDYYNNIVSLSIFHIDKLPLTHDELVLNPLFNTNGTE